MIMFRPRKRYFARANPPSELKNSETTVIAEARKSELVTYRQNVTGPFNVGCGLRRARKLSKLRVVEEICDGGGRNEYRFIESIFLNAEQISHANGMSITVATTIKIAKRAYLYAA